MTCRSGAAPADEQRRALLPATSSGGATAALDLERAGDPIKRPPVSRLGLCVCALSMIALMALALTSAATWWSGSGDALSPAPGGESAVEKPRVEEDQKRILPGASPGPRKFFEQSGIQTRPAALVRAAHT